MMLKICENLNMVVWTLNTLCVVPPRSFKNIFTEIVFFVPVGPPAPASESLERFKRRAPSNILRLI